MGLMFGFEGGNVNHREAETQHKNGRGTLPKACGTHLQILPINSSIPVILLHKPTTFLFELSRAKISIIP